jgi:uncharacterized membrane protein YfcA
VISAAGALGVGGILVAAFVKGAIGFGYPTVATPLLALATDVRTAVVVLLFPNIVMDAIQAVRHPGLGAAARRHAALVVTGVVGTVVGTQFLMIISARAPLARPAWRVPARWERVTSPAVGFVVGFLGGVTNVPGTPLALYFQALGLSKAEFVRAIALTFLVFKIVQVGAVWQVGLMEPRLLALSAGATLVSLVAFRLGLWAQDRVPAELFRRAVLAFLGLIGVAMLLRALWHG